MERSSNRLRSRGTTWAATLTLVAIPFALRAETTPDLPRAVEGVGIEQRLDEQIPLDLQFRDSQGQRVQLGDFFQDRPVILALVYYRCPMLCIEVLNGLVVGLEGLAFDPGEDYELVVVSFNPAETSDLAAANKEGYAERFGRDGTEEGWHFLTGEEGQIRRLAEAVGFRYRYDEKTQQYAHGAGIMVLTPEGRLSRYFYGVDFPPRDLRLALVEASANEIGSAVDQVRLFCYQYDPARGKYTANVMNIVRLGGLVTVFGLTGFVGALWRWSSSRKKAPDREDAESSSDQPT